MLSAQTPSVPLEGAPTWLNALLILAPIAGGVLTVYLARGKKDDTSEEGSPPQMPTPPQVREMPKTADEQLDFARELVAEIKADRDNLARQLEEANRRLVAQDALIRRLESVIDAWTRPPRPPMGQQ